MSSFVVLHNITSPYRIHLFTLMAEELAARGVGFHVHFMAASPRYRPRDWRAEGESIPFPHTSWRDIGPTIRGKSWHLNPGLVAALARERAEYLLVGGPWDSLTALLASFTARRGTGIGWIEANTRTPGRIRGVVGALKRRVLARYDAIAVPGREGRAYTELLFDDGPIPGRLVYLPNIVDEARFRSAGSREEAVEARRAIGAADEDRVAICPARLIPNKGLVGFIRMLDADVLSGWRLYILGEGPVEDRLRAEIRERGLQDRVRLVPQVERDRMPAIYRLADLFVLPSVKDPNPLSVVEALHSGLPLLVSDRIGNYPEALAGGRTGWGFDPDDPAETRAAVRAAFGSSARERADKGEHARRVAAGEWGSRAAVRRFLDDIPVRQTGDRAGVGAPVA